MFDQFARLDEAHLEFLGMTAGLVLAAVTILGVVIAVQLRKLRQTELELGFKDELLLRGYTVDEAIRLITSQKPGWSQGVISVGDWMGRQLKSAACQMTDAAKRRRSAGGGVVGDFWNRAQPSMQHVRQQSGPWLQSAVRQLNRGVHWLCARTDDLARRLVTPRP